MTQFKRILVIVDPTARWSPAVERASALARTTGGSIWLGLFHGGSLLPWYRSFGEGAPRLEASLRDRVSEQLERLAEEVISRSGSDVDVIDDRHRPRADRIMGFVERHRIDVIIKDAGHDSAASRLVFVPLDWELLRESPVPVWFTAASDAPLPRSLAVAVDPTHAAHGAGAINDAILSSAANLARVTGASMQVLTAFAGLPFEPTLDPLGLGLGWNAGELLERMRSDHQAAFDTLRDRHSIPADDALLLQGPPGPTILDWMRKGMADLLVVGAIHRHGAERVFMGSTAEYLVSRAHCDTLAIPGVVGAGSADEVIV